MEHSNIIEIYLVKLNGTLETEEG